MSDWQDIEKTEQGQILDRIREIYEDHSCPAWLSNPKIVTQVVNVLGQNQ